jgi:hypothetical protein
MPLDRARSRSMSTIPMPLDADDADDFKGWLHSKSRFAFQLPAWYQ